MNLRVLRMMVLTGVPFGLLMGLLPGLLVNYQIGLMVGIPSGILFGLALALFSEAQRKRLDSAGDTFEGESVVYRSLANHFYNGEARGGFLILTSNRLAFRSHGFNAQNQQMDIPLEQIAASAPTLTMGIIPNGLSVWKKDGAQENFVVQGRKEWARRIQQMISAASDADEA